MTEVGFDGLLAWLNDDREVAAQKYEQVREGLIKLFFWRGHHDAEDLADEVIHRVTGQVEELSKTYVGDPARYFFGVAKKVLLECDRRPRPQILTSIMTAPDEVSRNEENLEKERRDICLDSCLSEQDPADRNLILRYYRENKQAKINFRKLLARELGIDTNALRVRVYRIRSNLKGCIEACLKTRQS